MTPAERALWALLRGRQLGYKFRRQHPLGPVVLDFVCLEAGLVIEVDGGYLRARRDADRRRDRWLGAMGLLVLRLSNEDVLEQPERTLLRIRRALASAA